MTFRFLPVVALLALISGCAQIPAAAANDDAQTKADQQNLPKVELTGTLLYSILASEIAAQRGDTASAAKTYLYLAQETKDPRMAQRASELGAIAGLPQLAREASQYWLQLDPSSRSAQEQSLLLQLRTGRMADSITQIEALLNTSTEAQKKSLFNLLALTMPQQTDKAGALAYMKQLAERYRNLPEAQFALITSAGETGDQQSLDRAFDRLAKTAPDWDLPVAWQVEKLRHNNLDGAITFLKRELDRRPNADYELQAAYPKLLVTAKRYDDARTAFIELLKRYPNQAELLYAAGLLSYQEKDLDAAHKYLKAALDANHPDSDFIRYSLGQIAAEQKQPDQARYWYAQVRPGNQYLPAQAQLALLEAKDGDLEQALQRIDKLPKNNKERVEAAALQARLAMDYKRNDLAKSILNKALVKFPRSPELLYQRAMLNDELGNYKQSESDLRQYLKLRPDDATGLNALGYTLTIRSTRYGEAQRYIEKALRSEPKNGVILDSMGWVLYKQGRTLQALPYLQQAWEAVEDPEVAAHLGEVLFELGRREEGRAVMLKGYEIDQDSKPLLETMHRYGVPKP